MKTYKKTAFVIGNNGQDGNYLTNLLKEYNYRVVGVNRNGVTCDGEKTPFLVDLSDRTLVQSIVSHYLPDEIYYLAAVHQSSEESQNDTHQSFLANLSIHVIGLLNFLDAITVCSPTSKFFYASSSHIFGDPRECPQNEETPFRPICQYGITKTTGVEICQFYRKEKGIFCSVGILYNHESPLRSIKFLSKKIVTSAVKIKLGLQNELILGKLDASVDWGHAQDFVNAMHKILQLEYPDNFIIATGRLHSVKDFVDIAFNSLEIEKSKHLLENNNLLKKRNRAIHLCGDISKISLLTGWKPKYSFKEMIEEMVLYEIEKQQHNTK